MIPIKEALKCALLAALCLAVACGIRIELATESAMEATPALLDARLASIGGTVNAELIAELDKQAAELRKQINALTVLANLRTEDAISLADRHAANTETIIDSQLTALNATLSQNASPIGALAERYTVLPDQIRADRETQGLIAETMGVLGATKVTMGQVAKASKTFDEKWPAMLENTDRSNKALADIAVSLDKWIERLTMPQSIKSQIASWLKLLILAASRIL